MKTCPYCGSELFTEGTLFITFNCGGSLDKLASTFTDTDLCRARQSRNAWRDYAEHLENCCECASDRVGACHRGKQLKDLAEAIKP